MKLLRRHMRAFGFFAVSMALGLTGCVPNVRPGDYAHGFISKRVGNGFLSKSFSASGPMPRLPADDRNFEKLQEIDAGSITVNIFYDRTVFSAGKHEHLHSALQNDVPYLKRDMTALSKGVTYPVRVNVYLTMDRGITQATTATSKEKVLSFAFSLDSKDAATLHRTLATIVHELTHATEPHAIEEHPGELVDSEKLATTMATCFMIDTIPKAGYITFDLDAKPPSETGFENSATGALNATKAFLSVLGANSPYTLELGDTGQVAKVEGYCNAKRSGLSG